MMNANQLSHALSMRDARPPERVLAPQSSGARDVRIASLREKINDTNYLENALLKLANDLAREFF